MCKSNIKFMNKLENIKEIESVRIKLNECNYRIDLQLDIIYNIGSYNTIEAGFYNFKASYGIIRIDGIEKEIKTFQAWLNFIYKNIDEYASYYTRDIETAKNTAKEIIKAENKKFDIIDRYKELKYLLTRDIDPKIDTEEYCSKLISEAHELEVRYPELTYQYR